MAAAAVVSGRRAALSEVLARIAGADARSVAVEDGERRIDYGRLEARAGGLARRLVEAGVQPNDVVGLLLGPGIEMIVAALACWKAGAGYLPLDPGDPPARLARLVEDSRPALVVAAGDSSPSLGAAGVRVLALDAVDDDRGEAPAPAEIPEAVAYVNYTSGSTGTPKGVVVPRRAVANLALGQDYVELGPGDRVAQAATPSFDAFTFEVWATLAHGATAVVAPRAVLLGGASPVEAWLVESRITVMFLTTALFQSLVSRGAAPLGSLRTVLFGGEPANPEVVRAATAAHPRTRILHMYGPTEATTFTTWFDLAGWRQGEPLPVGLPLAGAHLDLDGAGEGEVMIGGEGVAGGYLGRPRLTAERFIPDARGGGGTVFRSGDRGRLDGDGRLVLSGRLDRQVKVRGFRVEPGEIEAVIRALPGVTEAAVIAHGTGERRRLVAFTTGTAAVEEIRQHLRQTLPRHMVPSLVVAADALPLGRNGKIDGAALTLRADALLAPPPVTLADVYRVAPEADEVLGEELPVELRPRGPEMLLGLLDGLGVDGSSRVLDAGCGAGVQACEIAAQLRCQVLAVDALESSVAQALQTVALMPPAVRERVRVLHADLDDLPVEDGSQDAVWCRDVLYHVPDLAVTLRELRRTLRPGGTALVFQTFATDQLEPGEAARLCADLAIVRPNLDRETFAAAAHAAGLEVVGEDRVGSEWREFWEELGEFSTAGQLLEHARLVRLEAHYRARLGDAGYRVARANRAWGAYQLLGKLCPWIYVLRR